MLLHNHKLNFLVIAISALFASCGEHFFPQFKVDQAEIEGQKVIVRFSAPVNASSIKENFYFTQDDSTMNGEMSFLGKTVVFEPADGITENHCYQVLVYTGAEDDNGNSLEEEYKKTFYTKTDLSRPKVFSIENILNAQGQTTAIKIEFSKQMNQYSVAESLLLEPSAEFITKWNENNDTVELLFKKALSEKTHYTLKIDTSAKDALNNFFEKEFTWSFENFPNYIKPEYTFSAFNFNEEKYQIVEQSAQCIDFSKPLIITFNKKIDSNKFAQNISIEPKANYEVKARLPDQSNFSDTVEIRFKEQPLWDTNCVVSISKNITDSYGTQIQEKTFVLKNNAEKLRPPTFQFLLAKVDGKYEILSKENDYRYLNFDTEKYQPKFPKDFPLYFIFRISGESSTINELSAMEAINVLPQNSCADIVLQKITVCAYNEIQSYDEGKVFEAAENARNELGTQGKLVCVKYDSTFTNKESNDIPIDGVINFTIAKTLCDNNKNYTEEAVQINCNKK